MSGKSHPSREAFDNGLLESVRTSLVEVLGEKITAALQFYVDLRTALRNPDRFLALVFELVGPRQARNFRETLLRNLHRQYGKDYYPTESKLSEAISKLREQASGQ